jgi:hypothetical protein
MLKMFSLQSYYYVSFSNANGLGGVSFGNAMGNVIFTTTVCRACPVTVPPWGPNPFCDPDGQTLLSR